MCFRRACLLTSCSFWCTGGFFFFQAEDGIRDADVTGVQTCAPPILLFATLAVTTGRRFPHLVVPGAVLSPTTRLIGAVQRRLPDRWHYPADREGVEIMRRSTRFDDSAARKEVGVEPRSFAETITDMVRWLVESGRV